MYITIWVDTDTKVSNQARDCSKERQMGKCAKGFSLIELLIVVAIILIIAAIAIPNFLRSRVAANQSSAVASLHTLAIAQMTYSSTYGGGFSADITSLAPPPGGGTPSSTAAGLIDSTLASGVKSGYIFTYSPGAVDTTGRINAFSFTAVPVTNSTGTQYYFTDTSGVIRQNSTTTAASTDSPVGN
jgi:prepilin-type N-terminal cleavage/methylation domain-containing protein